MAIGMTRFGDLTCFMFGPMESPEPPKAVVILCHGFGASGDDLASLAPEMARIEPSLAKDVVFVFPEGPLEVPEVPGGRCWWPLDMAALQRAVEMGEFRDMRQQSPPELPDARNKLVGVIESLQERTKLPLSRFILGGFSQGSMLATDVALRLPEKAGGLLVFSGTLLVEPEWRELAPKQPGLDVLQSHGTIDPLLPYAAAQWLRDLLTESGSEGGVPVV